MATPRFFHPELIPGRIALSAEESAHAGKSRRLQSGDSVVLFDGQGHEAIGRLVSANRKVEIEIDEIRTHEWSGPRLTIATAIPKGSRQDTLIEKCTELGVWAVWGVDFGRSVVKAGAAKKSKWTRTAIEASKQCGRSWLPKLELPITFDDLIARSESFDQRFVGDPKAESLGTNPISGQTILAVVGPEGGLTDAESSALHQAGYRSVSWGRFVLRIETAAIAAAAVLR